MKPLVVVAALIAAGVYFVITAGKSDNVLVTVAGDIKQGVDEVTKSITGWNENKIPPEYKYQIADAEIKYGLPTGMLGRLLWQESHFRSDIINGTTRSRVGALGIAQFMPATAAELGIDPLNVSQAIDAAARYLMQLRKNTNNWAEALAAYNWGIGNVKRKGIAAAPSETQSYFTSILSDINHA